MALTRVSATADVIGEMTFRVSIMTGSFINQSIRALHQNGGVLDDSFFVTGVEYYSALCWLGEHGCCTLRAYGDCNVQHSPDFRNPEVSCLASVK